MSRFDLRFGKIIFLAQSVDGGGGGGGGGGMMS